PAQHSSLPARAALALGSRPVFEAAGVWDQTLMGDRHAWFFAVLHLLRPRARRLGDFVTLSNYCFTTDGLKYDPAAVDKHLRGAGMSEHLVALETAWAELATFDPLSIEMALRAT